MSAPEIAANTALGLLHILASAEQPPDLYDVTARAIWTRWAPLRATYPVPNPIGSYLGRGLVVNRTQVVAGLCLCPLTDKPPYRYSPSIETAAAALRLLLTGGTGSELIARRLGYAGEADLADVLGRLPSDAQWRSLWPRGRRPPKVKAGPTNQGE